MGYLLVPILVVAPGAPFSDGAAMFPQINLAALLWLSPIVVFGGLAAILACGSGSGHAPSPGIECRTCRQSIARRLKAHYCPKCGAPFGIGATSRPARSSNS